MPVEARSKIASPSSPPRVFVLIASYRDPECQWTVKDLFDQAAHPERVFIGICWQSDPEEDQHCFEVPAPRPDQVRIVQFHWRDSRGVCWARNQAQGLWQGEEYVFITDAHMRFVAGWDDAMIGELAECPSPKPVISCNPADYTPPRTLIPNPLPTIRRATPFSAQGEMRFKGEGLDIVPDHPLNGAFIANGYVFARSDILREVPIDPYLYFNQEECTYAARLWTHGWDIFHSRQVLSFHYYNNTDQDATRVRPLHWSDNSKWRAINDIAYRRYGHLFEHTISTDPDVLSEIDTYGMGTARTLEQYRDYCGLDFKKRVASDKALRCGFIVNLEKYRKRPIAPEAAVPESPHNAQPMAGCADGVSITARSNAGGGLTYAVGLSRSALEANETKVEIAATTVSVATDPTPPVVPGDGAPVIINALQSGDFLPMFTLQDQAGKWREIHLYVGKPLVICCLPPGAEMVWREFLSELPAIHREFQRRRAHFIPVIPAAPATVTAMMGTQAPPVPIWTDLELRVSRLFGLAPGNGGVAAVAVLNQNLKLQDITLTAAPLKRVCTDVAASLPLPSTEPPVVISTRQAPVLLVEQALPLPLCADLIRYWEDNERFSGKVGDGPQSALNYGSKRRTDCYLGGDLLALVDATLLRTLTPEVEKVFGFHSQHRELYKIGCYDASEQGFFQAHRDNFSNALGHRRVAMSLNLSGDYVGGEVNFPEYGPQLYRADAGNAVVFPCGLMHEVRPVTSGRRLTLISFLFGAREEEFRQQQLAAQGRAPDAAAYRFQAQPVDPEGLRRSVAGSERR